jgi:electron transport complex protein RnfC
MLKTKIKPHGGIHPDSHKFLTADQQIRDIALPRQLILPLKQHTGPAAVPVVQVGDTVLAGQMIAKSQGRTSAPVHTGLSGKVAAIDRDQQTITIQVNREQQESCPPMSLATTDDTETSDIAQMLAYIEQAGIVGMGGAMFPAAEKIRGTLRYPIDHLIINGSECEPYLTVDDRLMQEQSAQLMGGIRYLQHISAAKHVYIGIENNKPEAIRILDELCTDEPNMDVMVLPAFYPMGSAKQMIEAITGKQIPRGTRSSALGVLVQNVGTTIAIFNAIRFHRPLTHRVITVSGGAIEKPANLRVPIGTPVKDLIEQCGGLKETAARMILGGPMMGRAIDNLNTPITKGVSGLLLLTADEIPDARPSSCVRCGRCLDACPMSLAPLDMVAELKIDHIAEANTMGLSQCLLCGSCAYVCPAAIPLTQYFDWGQQEMSRLQRMERKTRQTALNSTAHRARMEKEAAEREAAKNAKASSRRTPRASATKTASQEAL